MGRPRPQNRLTPEDPGGYAAPRDQPHRYLARPARSDTMRSTSYRQSRLPRYPSDLLVSAMQDVPLEVRLREIRVRSGIEGHVGGEEAVGVAVQVLAGSLISHRVRGSVWRAAIWTSLRSTPASNGRDEGVAEHCGCVLVIWMPEVSASRRRRRVVACRSIRIVDRAVQRPRHLQDVTVGAGDDLQVHPVLAVLAGIERAVRSHPVDRN
jgi:hypothetical protein